MSTPSRRPSAPTTRVVAGPTVPAWALHVALAAAAVGAVCAAAAGTAVPGTSLVVLLVGLLVAVAHAVRRPSRVPAAAVLTATGLAGLWITPFDELWRVPVLVLCVHLVVRLTWFTTSTRPGTRIETAVLRHEARTFLAIDLAGQAVGVLALVLTALQTDGALGRSGVLGITGAVALLGLTALLLRSSRTA